MTASAAAGSPAHGDGVTVELQLCCWRCLASGCPRQTFSDYTHSIARWFTRRISRVGEVVNHLGYVTGGRSDERLLHRLAVDVSDDKVLRQLKRHAQDTAQPPSVIDTDDWSWRESQTHGNIIIDLEWRTVSDVLEDRTVENCTKLLRHYSDIEVVSFSLYAEALSRRRAQPRATIT